MQVTRIVHLRSPLVIRNYLCKREQAPTIIPDRAGFFGGSTIIIEGDTDKPGFVTVREARCRFSDNYARKLGVTKAKEANPEVIELRNLAAHMRALESSMLLRCVPALRHGKNDVAVEDCMSSWDHIIRHFLPAQKKEVANG